MVINKQSPKGPPCHSWEARLLPRERQWVGGEGWASTETGRTASLRKMGSEAESQLEVFSSQHIWGL